jgi:hypothetical protein
VLVDGARTRVWWCSQLPGVGPAGDDVLTAEAVGPGGPFSSAVPVFHGGAPGSFDATHTCDPSVIKVGETYYLYYTGAAGEHTHGNAVGVASSPDGISWTRPAGGRPVVSAAGDRTRENTYGAGQPAALFLDGWYYLMFTDTSGEAAGPNGAGQFVVRARTHTFDTGVEALGVNGFRAVPSASTRRTKSVVDAFSADWMWVDALDAFAIAHQTTEGTTISFWDRDFLGHPYQPLLVKGPWREGPGLVRRADGHAPVDRGDPCGRVDFDVLRAVTERAAPTDITWFGVSAHVEGGCADPQRAALLLRGFALPAADRTVQLVVPGGRVKIERRTVAERFATAMTREPVPAVDRLPLLGEISAGVTTLSAGAGRVGLLLADGRVWPIGTEDVARLNSSPVTVVGTEDFDARRQGLDLTRVRTP